MRSTAGRSTAGRLGLFSLGAVALAAGLAASTLMTSGTILPPGAILHVVASGGSTTPGCPASSPCSLASALAQAKGADPPTVVLGPGTYLGTMVITFSVNVVGSGEGNTILKSFVNGSPVVVADSGVANLSQLTVTGGRGGHEQYGAGGVDVGRSATLTLNHVDVTGNSYSVGPVGAGGIANLGTLTLVNSAVTRNTASISQRCSGGIVTDGTMTIENSIVSMNSCTRQYIWGAGGIINSADTLPVPGSLIVKTPQTENLSILQSSITANSSAADDCQCATIASGGIINSQRGGLYLSGSSITGNSGNGLFIGLGGGLLNAGTATVVGGLLADNSVIGPQGDGGGGIYNDGTLTMTGPGGLDMDGANFGGGLFNDCSGTASLTGTSIQQDTATVGPAIFSDGTLNTSAVSVNPGQELQTSGGSFAQCDLEDDINQ